MSQFDGSPNFCRAGSEFWLEGFDWFVRFGSLTRDSVSHVGAWFHMLESVQNFRWQDPEFLGRANPSVRLGLAEVRHDPNHQIACWEPNRNSIQKHYIVPGNPYISHNSCRFRIQSLTRSTSRIDIARLETQSGRSQSNVSSRNSDPARLTLTVIRTARQNLIHETETVLCYEIQGQWLSWDFCASQVPWFANLRVFQLATPRNVLINVTYFEIAWYKCAFIRKIHQSCACQTIQSSIFLRELL